MSYFRNLHTNIRFYILLLSLIISILIYFKTRNSFLITTTQAYAFITVTYLYLALLIGPLGRVVKNLPFKVKYIKARRAIGVSAFYFATLHAYFALTETIGGFGVFFSWPITTQIWIYLSTVSLIILFLMAVTSFDLMIQKLTLIFWKRLHRMVYLASFFIVIHATMMGSHFADLGDWIPGVFYGAAAILIILHAISFYQDYRNNIGIFANRV